jgi:hypothetical protein
MSDRVGTILEFTGGICTAPRTHLERFQILSVGLTYALQRWQVKQRGCEVNDRFGTIPELGAPVAIVDGPAIWATSAELVIASDALLHKQ